jgi:hypothetical protein
MPSTNKPVPPNTPDEAKVSDDQGAPKKTGPHDPSVINPKLASDIQYWAKELHVTGQQLHEAIRKHGTHVSKIREALKHHQH